MGWAGASFIVSLLAFAVSVYAIVEGKRAPARARQRQLWDDLRDVLEQLRPALESASLELRIGHDVTRETTELDVAVRRLGDLGPRFSEPTLHARLRALAATLLAVHSPWFASLFLQRQVSDRDRSLTDARKRGDAEAERVIQGLREEAARMRDAEHVELRELLRTAEAAVADWIGEIDKREKIGRI